MIENKFSYSIKFSTYRPEQTDYRGIIDLNNLLNEFRNFPWINELINPEMKTLPTISIQDRFTGYKLNISGILIEKNVPYFNVYYVWPNQVRMVEKIKTEKAAFYIKRFFSRDFGVMGQDFKPLDE